MGISQIIHNKTVQPSYKDHTMLHWSLQLPVEHKASIKIKSKKKKRKPVKEHPQNNQYKFHRQSSKSSEPI